MTASKKEAKLQSQKAEETRQSLVDVVNNWNTSVDGRITIAKLGKKVGLQYRQTYRYIEEFEEIREGIRVAKEESIDIAEDSLWDGVKQGLTTETIFFLKTQGKSRGYIDRVEHTGQDGLPVTFKVVTNEETKGTLERIAKAL